MGTRSKLGLLTLALLATLSVAIPSPALAARRHAYSTGTYSAHLYQLVPRRYTGKLSFAVTRGSISLLRTVFYAHCQGVGLVRVSDPVPAFEVPIGSVGGFSYSGTVAGRRLRFSGILHGRTVTGAFFETFAFGTHACSTERGAAFTGSL